MWAQSANDFEMRSMAAEEIAELEEVRSWCLVADLSRPTLMNDDQAIEYALRTSPPSSLKSHKS